MRKTLFSKKLDEKNIRLRDYLLNKFSHYVSLNTCDLLEVGCGNGRFAALLGPNIKSYTCIEPDEEYLKSAQQTSPRNVEAVYYQGRAEDIPITGKTFAIILYAFSWHFIKDFDMALKEAKRLLEEEGIMVIYEPSKDANNWASSRLRKGSPDFDKEAHTKKLFDLDRGRKALYALTQKGMASIIEEDIDKGEQPNLWVVRPSI